MLLYRIVINTCFTNAKKQNKYLLQNNIDSDKSVDNITGYDKLVASERRILINKVLKKMKPDEFEFTRIHLYLMTKTFGIWIIVICLKFGICYLEFLINPTLHYSISSCG